MSEFDTGDKQVLAYDLRQRYAKLVADHLEDISFARKNHDYSNYFNGLIDVYTITRHKFKTKGSREEFEILKQKIIKLANEHKDVWGGNNNGNSNSIAEIENSLRQMEMLIYDQMDKAKMFGSQYDMSEAMF